MTEETEAWRSAFNERHQFDVYPDHFMSGMRNEFCAGWQAALKSQAASQPKALTDEQRKALNHLVSRGSTFPDHNGPSGSVSRVDYAHLRTAAKLLSALLESTK